MKEYEELIAWLEDVPRYGHKDGLNNMITLMNELGNPQQRFPAVHVAGTNGKGSCCAMLTQILTEAGYKTGRYTSPHLVDYRERIAIGADAWISEADFVRIGGEVRAAIGRMTARGENHASFFEILTAVAFCYFAEQKVDWAVIEVGVGGRLDATNILQPRLCMITSISLDHTKVLGSTPAQIAAEKAGILKKNTPVVLSYNPSAVYTVIKAKAAEKASPFLYAGKAGLKIHYNDERGLCVDAEVGGWQLSKLQVNLRGDYQVQNLAAVLEAAGELRQQGLPITEEVLRRALGRVSWPGRMEYTTYAGHTLLLDGAHNGDAAARLADYLGTRCVGQQCVLVFSALEKKDTEAILRPLAASRVIDTMIFAGLKPGSHGMRAETAAELWTRFGGALPILVAPDVETALRWAVQADPDLVVCAGSLYLIGEVEALLRA